MVSGDVNATDRFLNRRYLQAFPRGSPVNDLARLSRLYYLVQHHALNGDLRYSGPWWYLAWALLRLRLHWLLRLQLVCLS